MAARYEVNAETNFNGLVLPLKFTLTRFDIKRSPNGEQRPVSTVVASTVKVSRLASDESLDVKLPAKTFVNDYRVSAGDLKGSSHTYVVDSTSNFPPTIEQLKRSGARGPMHVPAIHEWP